MSEVIVITSGKGGVGKTTATVNIGTALAGRGKKTVLIDTDIGLRNLDILMGLENRIIYNLVDIVEKKCSLGQALVRSARNPNLYLLPAAQVRDKDAVSPDQMIQLTELLRNTFDYILIDCPAGIEQGFRIATAPADHAIVAATPDLTSVRDADRVLGLLKKTQIGKISLFLNRVHPELAKSGDLMNQEEILEITGADLIGAVPYDEQVLIAANRGETVIGTGTLAGLAFENIAGRIMGEQVPFLNLSPEPVRIGLMERFASFFRKKESGN